MTEPIVIEVGVGHTADMIADILDANEGELLMPLAHRDAYQRHGSRAHVGLAKITEVAVDSSDPDCVVVSIDYYYQWSEGGGCRDANTDGFEDDTIEATYSDGLLSIEGIEVRSTLDEF